jgi:hypothetical protein
MRRLAGPVLLLLLVRCATGASQTSSPASFAIVGPTVIAFFPPITDAELDRNPDMNEVLGDFQLYASRAGPRLKQAGIDFEVASAVKFKVRDDRVVRTFKTGKVGVGYYFVAPGKPPHVEYGVHDDLDILDIARKYFQLPIPAA